MTKIIPYPLLLSATSSISVGTLLSRVEIRRMGMRVPVSPEGRVHVLAGVFILAGLLWAMVGNTEAQVSAVERQAPQVWRVKLSFEKARPPGTIRVSFPEIPLDVSVDPEQPLELEVRAADPPSRVLARIEGHPVCRAWLTQNEQSLEGQLRAEEVKKPETTRAAFRHWKDRVFQEHNWSEPSAYPADNVAVHRRALPAYQVEERHGDHDH